MLTTTTTVMTTTTTPPVCVFDEAAYFAIFGQVPMPDGPIAWIEKDYISGYSSTAEQVHIGDVLQIGVEIQSNCRVW